MSWLFALAYDPFMRSSEEACLAEWRRALLAPIEGAVLEIGAGTGANLDAYPPRLERLVLTDPDADMLARLAPRASRRTPTPEVLVAGADALPFREATFDAVVATLVLCSVPDPAHALAEIRRVLRPGGAFYFMDHVAGEPGSSRLRWQRRADPVWRRVAGNCHLSRDTERAISDAGFTFETLTRDSMRKALPIVRPTIRGIARAPSAEPSAAG